MAQVLLMMGSDSDLPIVEECEKILASFSISYETRVLSAHRTPSEAADAIHEAEKGGTKVIIGFAGLAAHLPGVIASHTTLPVIGVPIAGGPMQGVDALYSIVQMPGGIPVATMAIGKAGAKNAALHATAILALSDTSLSEALIRYREEMRKGVLEKDATVRAR